jgi:hypothetical protein
VETAPTQLTYVNVMSTLATFVAVARSAAADRPDGGSAGIAANDARLAEPRHPRRVARGSAFGLPGAVASIVLGAWGLALLAAGAWWARRVEI